jgi:hypothetical protein
MAQFDSFTKALRAAFYADDASKMISEFKQLSETDKVELSTALIMEGYEHPQYVAK